MLEAGRGLAAAHAAGILHRDFKPDNVLVAADGRVCVGDFGLADVRIDGAPHVHRPEAAPLVDPALETTAYPDAVDSAGALRLTTTGAVIGTPAYMAPEQLNGAPIDARADQFSYAVALFEALHGTRPFDSGGEEGGEPALRALRAAIAAGRIVAPPPGSKVPAWLDEQIARGLAAAPVARWPSLADFLHAMTRRRSRRRDLGLVAALVVAVAAVGVAIAVAARSPEPAASPPPAAPPIEPTRRVEMPRPGFFDVSADGKEFVFVEARRAVAGRLGDPARRTIATPTGTTWTSARFAGADRVLLVANGAQDALHAWTPSTGALEPLYAGDDLGRHIGATRDGRWLFGRRTATGAELVAARAGGSLEVLFTFEGHVAFEESQLSPDGASLVVGAQRDGTPAIALLGLEDRQQTWLPFFADAAGWIDDDTIAWSAGQPESKIHALGLAGTPPGRLLIARKPAWITQVLGRAGTVFYQDVGNHRAARAIGVDGKAPTRDFSPTEGTHALVWASDDAIYARDGRTGGLIRISLDGDESAVPNDLAGAVGRATRSDDILIVTVGDRRDTKCEVVGLELSTGTTRWRHASDCKEEPRCGGDSTGACITYAMSGHEFVARRLDPATGAIGDEIVRVPLGKQGWYNAATSADGTALAMVDGTSQVHLFRLPGGAATTVTLPDNRIGQFVAVEADGSALVTAMDSGNAGDYALYRVRDGAATLIGYNESRWMYALLTRSSENRSIISSRVNSSRSPSSDQPNSSR
jgi:sugar lactone lactonase YvrE